MYLHKYTARQCRGWVLRPLPLWVKNGTKPKLALDVDLEAVGQDSRLDGYTGADLSSLVIDSFRQAFQESILKRENHPLQSNGNSNDNDIDVLVHRRHFDIAISISKPSVGKKVSRTFRLRFSSSLRSCISSKYFEKSLWNFILK